MPAIANAVHHGSDILMVVLDNGATVTSGFQPNPGVPRDALGRPAPALDIERIARAIGVEFVRDVGPDDLESRLPDVFREGLTHRGLGADHRAHAVRSVGIGRPDSGTSSQVITPENSEGHGRGKAPCRILFNGPTEGEVSHRETELPPTKPVGVASPSRKVRNRSGRL